MKLQKPFAQMEQSPADSSHAATVGKLVRCLHLCKADGKFDGKIESTYGNAS